MKLIFGLILILISFSWAHALPKNMNNYALADGPFMTFHNQSIIEGSVQAGGTQPDYLIDEDAPELKPMFNYAKRVGKENIDLWSKIRKIESYLNKNMFPKTDYEDPDYLRLINRYRTAKQDIPLSRYAACGSGVCREHAILMHLALKYAGIKNYYVYAKIHRSSTWENWDIIEDHAFNVIEVDGKKWVVDAYYWGFNGFLLSDLMSKKGITEKSEFAPIANPDRGFRNIMKIHDYKIWHLKEKMCAFIFN